MQISNFFNFNDKLSSATLQAHAINLPANNSRLSRDLQLLTGDYSNFNFPIIFKQEYGNRLDDIIRTGYPDLYMISERMKDILESNNLTGWKTFSVTVLDHEEKEIKGYCGLSVIGKCGPIDYNKSEIIEKKLVIDGPLIKWYKGQYIGLDRWDGMDFFLPEGYYGIIVTEKAAKIIKKNKLTNIKLIRLSEIEVPEFIVKV